MILKMYDGINEFTAEEYEKMVNNLGISGYDFSYDSSSNKYTLENEDDLLWLKNDVERMVS
jgi:hypothetical protein